MMKKLKKRIEEDISFELAEANKNYPLFASDHEGLAIIGEEMYEAKKEMEYLKNRYGWLEDDVYTDEKDSADDMIDDVIEFATNLACEAIQVAAMGHKWKLGRRQDKRLEDMSMPELIEERRKVEKEIRTR